MNETDLAASVERLMARVDYYLHCELDEEYDHDRPDTARRLLEAALRRWRETPTRTGSCTEASVM